LRPTTNRFRTERLDVASDVATLRPYELALREIKGRVETGDNAGFEVGAAVADKILTATDIEGVIAAVNQGPGRVEDLVGKPFKFAGYVRYADSAEQYKEGGTGQYVIFDYIDMNNEKSTVSTGAVNVVFQIRAMEKLGYFNSDDWVSDKLFTIKPKATENGTLYSVNFA
jgi:hypothetical protein